MRTTVDKTWFPALPCNQWAGWNRRAARRGLTRCLAMTLSAVALTGSIAQCQAPNQPRTSGGESKTAPISASKRNSSPIVDPPEGSVQPSPSAMSLEEMLSTALKDNPDIRVTEAKLREAETQLNRVRLEVAQKVMVFRNEWDIEKAKIEKHEAGLKASEGRWKNKAISQEEYRKAQVDFQVNRAMLTKLEAELPYLLGRAPQPAPSQTQSSVTKVYALQQVSASDAYVTIHSVLGGQQSGVNVVADDRSNALIVIALPETQAMIEALIRKLDGADRPSVSRTRARSPMEDKILKALDIPIDVSFQDKPLDELLKDLRKSSGIPFVADPAIRGSGQPAAAGTMGAGMAGGRGGSDRNPMVTLDLGEVPLVVALQAIQDSVGVYFAVRDYGVHVSRSKNVFSEGGIGAVDFWKRERQSEQKAPEQ